ncbi:MULTISPECIES: heptaprenyl diphosphate synthase component 1 [Thermoactinomyces]|jgi:hypothetical protein|uniref:Heptaprenyl diphosphate synthase component 1 n=1 Tax=Thermoactinomyces vulgaris TaxID=2026 RepID=A0ABS0QEC0_THEVU|nr:MULTISPECIES: heptaprenyl diphosphate synthase component 1 [Thermoactinomyces]KYQ87842.1 hypothetical protein AYX07_03975 [Thermoactinomyces sp. AS95]MBA4550422.1 heptaprenyl diphosphate synthase component 1 [Thermoactinomyces vulgaris]MBA4595833.1 heptaprenyl diphosphate synthase component 1 [Thermoactinomyces vulgaris]MBH8582306.1 heptaprenyl diphosphate synthase component 1 [Thermoactinomyces sp. CICC 10735]MBH8584898.1 heptaprenyl diphosphate synthase component 1 [Thermoactinomyces sp. 
MAFIHNESLNQLITQIQNDANHKYVRKIIGEAEVPVFFVQVLQWLLGDLAVDKKRADLYILATTLVKMGTDMHERVAVASPDSENEQKQQLTVLAGDHYSSLFYWHLAGWHETEGIRCLAGVTCRVNEWKMSLHSLLHDKKDPDVEKVWFYFEKIATAWVTALADFFHVEENLKVQIAKALVVLYETTQTADSRLHQHEVWTNELRQRVEFLQEAGRQAGDPFLTFLIHQLPETDTAVSKASDES